MKQNKKSLDTYRKLLVDKRRAITGTLNNLQSGIDGSDLARSAASGDSADMGSETFEADFALSIMQSEGDVVQQIDEALERIEGGNYGQCTSCSRRILKARLTAIPWTSCCIDCQRKAEAS